MHRHLCFILATLLSTQMGANPAAWACSSSDKNLPVKERYDRASTVFLGRLVRVEEAAEVGAGDLLSPAQVVEATVEVVEAFKGTPPPGGKLRAPGPATRCGLLSAAFEYVFFLSGESIVRFGDDTIMVEDSPLIEDIGDRKRLLDKLRGLAGK